MIDNMEYKHTMYIITTRKYFLYPTKDKQGIINNKKKEKKKKKGGYGIYHHFRIGFKSGKKCRTKSK
jgi:hypothetical protein